MRWPSVRWQWIACIAGCGRIAFAPLDQLGDDASGPLDVDGDDVPTEADNCPSRSNPTQHDEDSDGLGDHCDGCPPIADPEQVDLDGDLVTGPCDPNPTIAGDLVTYFEGFGAGFPASFQLSGAWTVDPDAVSTNPGPDIDSSFMLPFVPDSTATVSAGFSPLQRNGTTANQRGLGIIMHSPGFTSGLTCAMWVVIGTTVEEAGFVDYDGGISDATAYPWSVGTDYIAIIVRNDTTTTCDMIDGTTRANVASVTTALPSLVSFLTRSTAVRVDWVMLVDSP